MKRGLDTTDAEWSDMLAARKKVAEQRMERDDNMNGFTTIVGVHRAAKLWYGDDDFDNCHKAEQRLIAGELP